MANATSGRAATRLRAGLVAAATILAIAVPAAPVRATQTHQWVGSDTQDTHDWGRPNNWDTQAVPQAGDTVIIRNASVTNVPSATTLGTVVLSDGAELASGGPFDTDNLELRCARLKIDTEVQDSALIIGGELRPGSGSITFTNRALMTIRTPTPFDDGCGEGVTIDPGVLKVFSGARIVNRDNIVATDGEVLGMSCCTSPQVLENTPAGRIDTTNGLTLTSMRLLQRGTVQHGSLLLDGGDHQLADGSVFSDVDVIADGAVITVQPPDTGTRSTITLGTTSTLSLRGEGDLFGTAAWAGNGTLILEKGSIHGDQKIGAGVTFRTTGPATKRITAFGPGDPGLVSIDGVADLRTGPLTIGGQLLVNNGKLVVKAGEQPVLTGKTCCTDPIPSLRNRGRIELAATANLTIESMRLDSSATVTGITTTGAGELILDGGDHKLRNGNTLDAPVTLRGGAIVRVGGTTIVKRTVDQMNGTTLQGGSGTTLPTIAGTGAWTWYGGDVAGNVEFGKDLSVRVTGDLMKRTTTPNARIGVAGKLRIDGPGELRLMWGTTFATTGPVTLAGANVRAGSCCTDPPSFTVGGTLGVVKAAGASLIGSTDTRFTGTVDLNGGVLTIDTFDPTFAGTGKLKLEGGSFQSAGVVLIGKTASLIGPGMVTGLLTVNGNVSFGTRGRLAVSGAYYQGSSGRLSLKFTTSGRDSVQVDGDADLGGSLALSGTVSSVAKPTTLLSATSRTGTFSVTGLPSSKKIVYGPTTVKIAPK